MSLYADVDGTPVPLTECNWVMWAPCGHICALCMAAMSPQGRNDSETVIAATEDEAWKHLEETRRQIEKSKRQGFRLELTTLDRYRTELASLFGKCDHDPEWGVR